MCFPVLGKQMCDIVSAVLILGYSPDYGKPPIKCKCKIKVLSVQFYSCYCFMLCQIMRKTRNVHILRIE